MIVFSGQGYPQFFVGVHETFAMDSQVATALDNAFGNIAVLQPEPRCGNATDAVPGCPMIILRIPKGWTGPREVDGKKVEGFWRAHQVPVSACCEDDGHRQILEQWMRSYQPQELFDPSGTLAPELRALAPKGNKRMGATPYANGGRLRRELITPDIHDFALETGQPGSTQGQATEQFGRYLSAIFQKNLDNFRLFGPDETASNRLSPVFDVTSRTWMEPIKDYDEQLARDGRVMEILSEHQCQG